jgi:hypothetical protein
MLQLFYILLGIHKLPPVYGQQSGFQDNQPMLAGIIEASRQQIIFNTRIYADKHRCKAFVSSLDPYNLSNPCHPCTASSRLLDDHSAVFDCIQAACA